MTLTRLHGCACRFESLLCIHTCQLIHYAGDWLLCIYVITMRGPRGEGVRNPLLETSQNIGFLAKIVSEYDQEIPQSQTADKPMAPRGRATQQSRGTRKTT